MAWTWSTALFFVALFTAGDMGIALAHELQHLRQSDTGWEIGLELLRPLFFWNPVFSLWKRQMESLRELACDQQLLARGRTAPRAYADCLLRVCAASLGAGPQGRSVAVTVPLVLAASPGNHRRAAALEARLTALLDAGVPQPRRWVGALALSVLLFGLSIAAVGVQRQGGWSQDRLMLATIVNLERLDQRPGFAVRGY
jgi:beta-lactamase regulating signal transducer with metallopeptidase domain